MTMATPPPVTSWHVTSQTEFTQIGTDGTPVRGVKVFFITGTGQQGSVFVPASQYTPDQVRAQIEQAAQVADQVGSLSSEQS